MRKSTAEQQSTGADVGQRGGMPLRMNGSQDSRKPSMTSRRTNGKGWEIRLGALQVVVWLGLSIGAVFGSYFIGFFSGRYVGFETARAASGVDVPKLAVTDEIPERSAQNMSGIIEQLSSNATITKEVKPTTGKGASGDARNGKAPEVSKGEEAAASFAAAKTVDTTQNQQTEPLFDTLNANYADAEAATGNESLENALVEDPGKGAEVRLLGQEVETKPAQQLANSAPIKVAENVKAPVAKQELLDPPVKVKEPTVEKVAPAEKVAQDSSTATPGKSSKAPAVVKKVPPGYFVQVAAPKTVKEAEVIAKRLKGSGFPVVIEDFSTGKSPYFRVLVGPEDNKVQAERLVGQVKREQYISGNPFIRQSK